MNLLAAPASPQLAETAARAPLFATDASRYIVPALVKRLGTTDYTLALQAMRAFTRARDAGTPDEIWLTEHAPVYTLGQAGRPEHVIDAQGVPVVASDRGGQVTWHGPGQLVAYLLIDLGRRGLTVRGMVHAIEAAVIALLAGLGIESQRRAGMPGVYVNDAKVAALGLKISRGCSYHGVALNIDCDLAAFDGIHPCGYRELAVTSLARLGCRAQAGAIGARLTGHLQAGLARSPG